MEESLFDSIRHVNEYGQEYWTAWKHAFQLINNTHELNCIFP